MKATDLRIGNYVKYDDEIIQVSVLRKNYVEFYDKEDLLIGDNPNEFQPIELTEEVLVKIGFGKHDEAMNIYAFENERAIVVYIPNRKLLRIEGVENGVLINRHITLNNVEYLHQLQNIYYCLTNEELEVNYERNNV